MQNEQAARQRETVEMEKEGREHLQQMQIQVEGLQQMQNVMIQKSERIVPDAENAFMHQQKFVCTSVSSWMFLN